MVDPIWPLGTPLSMLLYTSTRADSSDLVASQPLVAWHDLTFGDYKDEREVDLTLTVPESVRSHNGSWWMDVMLVKGGGLPHEGQGPNDIALYRKRASPCSRSWVA